MTNKNAGRLAIIFLCSQQHALANPEVAEKLAAGVWRSLVVGGTNVHDYPLTEIGRQRFESFRLDQDPS